MRERVREREEEPNQVCVSDVEQLFGLYDEGALGFVTVGVIKDRVRQHFSLPEHVLYEFLGSMDGMRSEEMLNMEEFTRLWRQFTVPIGTLK